ncbi:MAG: hypothetical protein H6836_08570 [Planctomycetes bacterium]|nr:hypothetical protein [Planctomycetota bacterium]
MTHLRTARVALLALLGPLVLSIPALAQTPAAPSTVNLRKIKRGPWNTKADIPKGWIRHRTQHYEVQSMCGKEKAVRLGNHMEAMFKVYWRRFPPGKPFTKRYTIKLLANRGAFRAYGAPPGAGAYYSPVDREMVCYDTGKWLDDQPVEGPKTGKPKTDGGGDPMEEMKRELERYKMDILGAASHEGWHQYFHWYIVSWVPIPSWINEGMGDYFYTAQPRKVKGRSIPAELGRLNELRLPVVQWAVKNNRHVPIKELLKYSQREYYSNPSICYAEGWALCQFLLHSGNRKYEAALNRFIKLVQDDTNMPAVTKKAFHGIDLDQLEAEWKAWITKLGMPAEKPGKPGASDKKRS